MLTISLLTPFALQHDGQPITLVSRRTEALFVYLLRTGQPQAREVLANLFWDDLPQTQAAGNLRVLIANLRKAVGTHVTITRQSVAFDHKSAFRCDLTDLEQGLTAARSEQASAGGLHKAGADKLAHALAGYQGEFLPGFYLRGGQGFDEWLATEREWLWTRAIAALGDLTAAYLRLGDYRAGSEQAQRLVKFDPLREESHQQLMQLLAADGQINAALAQYERCVQILDTELGVPPHPLTVELYTHIRDGTGQLARPLVDKPVAVQHLIPHNLPRPMTPFWGRTTELTQLATLLIDPTTPLITILGPGGMGKTALAIEAARRLVNASQLVPSANDERARFQDGIYLVALGAISDSVNLAPALADVIGYRFQKNSGDETTQLLRHLHTQSMLLLLDNAEHLLDATDLFSEILAAAPQVQLLVTSRHKLNLYGETVLTLAGLDYPAGEITRELGGSRSMAESLLQYSAVRLFVERSRRAQGDINLHDADMQAVAQICQLVQGMPLALLLGAAWVELLSPAEIAAEIAQNVAFLSMETGQPTADPADELPARQRSMRAVFNHAWQLLTLDEQQILARMSIFRAGCTRLVAQQVTGSSLRTLLSLVHKSLLIREFSAERFTIHVLLRQLAAEKLIELGQTAAPLHQLAVKTLERLYAQHVTPYYGELAEHAEQAGLIEKARRYLQLAGDVVRDNFQNNLAIDYYRRALALTPQTDIEAIFSLRMARQSIYHLLGQRAAQAEELRALANLSAGLGDTRRPIEVLLAQARYWETVSDYATAVALAQQAAQLAERVGETDLLCQSHLLWGQSLWRLGDLDGAQAQLDHALVEVQLLADPHTEATILRSLGIVFEFKWHYAQAAAHYTRSLAICRQIGNRQGEVSNLNNLGVAAFYQHDYLAAQHYLEAAVAIRRSIGDRRGEGHGLYNLGSLTSTWGDFACARRYADQALLIFREVGDRWGEADALHHLGSLIVGEGEYEKAHAIYQQALTLAQQIGYQRCAALTYRSLGHLARQQDQPAAAKQHYLAALTGARQANFTGYALEVSAGLAAVALQQGDPAAAQQLVDEVLAALNEEALSQAEEPLRIYYDCYRILQTTNAAQALATIQHAHAKLHQQADKIADLAIRQSFLHKVPIHHKISAAFAQR